jgi:RNA polymerase sigma factor for flagellar operon FliA
MSICILGATAARVKFDHMGIMLRFHDGDSADELWAGSGRNGDREARDRLIVHYAPLVRYVASGVSAGLPPSVDHGDLVSYGTFGLIDAIAKFDTSRHVTFERYATTRIKGAIIDGLRSADWVPRSIRDKARTVDRAYAKLEARSLRTPTDAEVAEELGISEDQLQKILYQISIVGQVPLDEARSGGGERGEATTVMDAIADRRGDPVATYEAEETKQLLAAAVNRLPGREKIVLTLYYYESLTLARIGVVLGLTEGRICQIHGNAVLGLRRQLLRPFLAAA